jgi:hypothetical protein
MFVAIKSAQREEFMRVNAFLVALVLGGFLVAIEWNLPQVTGLPIARWIEVVIPTMCLVVLLAKRPGKQWLEVLSPEFGTAVLTVIAHHIVTGWSVWATVCFIGSLFTFFMAYHHDKNPMAPQKKE